MKFNILFQDTDYVAIDKPSGILVHPTQISSDRISCLGVLKEQIGCWIYPVHRLDRATSGVLVFALSSDSARALKELWPQGKVIKTYRAVVRGFLPENGEIDRPLRESKDKERVPAMSRYRRLAQVERSDAVGKYASARYSLAEVETLTGRYHQVRKHLAGISQSVFSREVWSPSIAPPCAGAQVRAS